MIPPITVSQTSGGNASGVTASDGGFSARLEYDMVYVR